jgi:hypothetical protein
MDVEARKEQKEKKSRNINSLKEAGFTVTSAA